MLKPRIIPSLLLKNRGLVKGVRFKDHRYVGDPINAVHIFNSKEVDEILFLDITATSEKRIPPIDLVAKISDQCLVPFAVGGGIRSLKDAASLLENGAEKVCLNTAAFENPDLISEISSHFGVQSVVVSIDVGKSFFGGESVFTRSGLTKMKGSLEDWAKRFESAGAGEILLQSIEKDGTGQGYDLNLLKRIIDGVSVPVIIGCGVGEFDHLKEGLQAGASAVSAGSFFVFHGRRQAVLISYPNEQEKEKVYRGN